MRISTIVCFALSLGMLVATPARGQSSGAVGELSEKTKQAMENFDLLEFEAARKQLDAAIARAKKNGLGNDPALAKAYVSLGIVAFSGLNDEAAARAAFEAAVAIDPAVSIDVAYRTDAMSKLLDSVKADAGGGIGGGVLGSAISCEEIEAIDHQLVDTAPPGADLEITARVGTALGASDVTLYYRSGGESEFTDVAMELSSDCTYKGVIPASAMRGDAVHYYVSARDGKKALASRGSSGSPNLIEVGASSGSGSIGMDSDNPFAEVDTTSSETEDDGERTVFVQMALGTGGGYVSGTTEVAQNDVSCCFAPSLIHVMPELGYYLSRQMSLSLAFRMAFAVGANVPGHATAAPAGLLRLRYALAKSGEGFLVSGAIGGGIIRNTVKLEDGTEGMDTDTTASGPFLLGAGIGYTTPLSSSLQFIGELHGLAAVPGPIEELGTCPGAGCVKPSFGVQFDVNLGVQLAF